MQYAVCSVQCAVCSVQCAKCAVGIAKPREGRVGKDGTMDTTGGGAGAKQAGRLRDNNTNNDQGKQK